MARETEFEDGELVFVIDPSFEPVVRTGRVFDASYDEEIDVEFPSDPFNSGVSEGRIVTTDPMQLVHIDADKDEVYRLFGREDLIEEEA